MDTTADSMPASVIVIIHPKEETKTTEDPSTLGMHLEILPSESYLRIHISNSVLLRAFVSRAFATVCLSLRLLGPINFSFPGACVGGLGDVPYRRSFFAEFSHCLWIRGFLPD